MNSNAIIQKLTELNLNGAKSAFIRQAEDVNYQALSFNERFYNILESQEIYNANAKTKMLQKLSKIKEKQATIANIDYIPKRQINKDLILELASMNFIRYRQNIIAVGCTGSGKSFIIQALGNRAIEEGFKTFYIRVPLLLKR